MLKTFITFSLVILTVSMMITGCLTERVAKNKLSKVLAQHPNVITEACANMYPSVSLRIDSLIYLQGNAVYINDTVHTYDTTERILKQQAVSYKLRVDTIYRIRNSETVNKAKEQMLLSENNKMAATIAVKKSQNKMLVWVVVILGGYTLLRWLFRFWGIKLP